MDFLSFFCEIKKVDKMNKVEKNLKGSLNLIPSPSRSHDHLIYLFLSKKNFFVELEGLSVIFL